MFCFISFTKIFDKLSYYVVSNLSLFPICMIDTTILSKQMELAGPNSLSLAMTTAFFVSMVFTLQVVKEMLYLNTTSIIGAILTLAFIRELSPVLTSVILVGRVASAYTAELATMKVTDQLNALYLLESKPLAYLVLPRVIAFTCMLPILNMISFITSLASSIFVCFIFYKIDPSLFILSAISAISLNDVIKSSLKMFIFGIIVSLISCFLGLSAHAGAYGVGRSTTNAVVCCLLAVFIIDFVLSSVMFGYMGSSIRSF